MESSLELKAHSEVAHSTPISGPGDEAADQETLGPAARPGLPTEGTAEFHERCERAMEAVCRKYAYTAQQGGIVLRRNPLKLAPLTDYVFNRINKAEHGFRYYDKGWPEASLVSRPGEGLLAVLRT